MKTPHTPGPWRLSTGYIFAPDKSVVATVFEELPEEKANARLIAAAPELLAALNNIADVAAKIVEQSGSSQAAFIRDEARAAIAKAEGRS